VLELSVIQTALARAGVEFDDDGQGVRLRETK